MNKQLYFNSLKSTTFTPGLPWWLSGKESTANARDADLIPGLQRSPGEGNCNPLQYSCLEKSYGQSAWLQSMALLYPQKTIYIASNIVFSL